MVGAVVGLIAAVGYLAFRTPIQFAVLTVSGLGLGWVASVYKHLQRDGALGNDWKLLVCMLALVFGLGFVCVWQLRDPLFDQGTRYGEMLQFYDHSGFKALLDRYGFDAVMFFALQALGVLFTLMAFQIAVTHALGMLAEVADRHGRDLGYAEEWLLDRQRRAGIGPWGPAWAAVVACLFGLAFASGGIAAGVKAAKEEQQRSMRPRIERLHLIGARGAIFVRGAVEPAFPAGSAALDILVRRNQRLVRRVKRTMHKRTFAFKIRGEDGQSLNPGWYRVLINLDGTQLRNKIVRVRRAG